MNQTNGDKKDRKTEEAFDREMLLESFDQDIPFLLETFGMFLEDVPPLMERIQRAVHNRSAVDIHHTAHALKGMASNFQATPAFESAQALEMMGRNGDLADADAAFGDLQLKIQALEERMQAFIREYSG